MQTPEAIRFIRPPPVLPNVSTEPERAARFYWADQILRCDEEAGCVTKAKAALAAFLAAPAPTRFSLSGHIADENGAPLPEVAISLTGSESVSTITDSSGNFGLMNLPTAGSYVIAISKPHYSFKSQTLVTPTSDVTVELSGTLAQHSIGGRVFAETGQPLAGAILTLTGGEELTTISDSQGDYSFPNLPAGVDYLLTVSRDNYSFDVSSRSFPNLSEDFYAVFQGTLLRFTISGKMNNSDGTPLSGITMILLGAQNGTAVTNTNGEYSFPNLPAAGNYTITPTNSHYTFSPGQASIQNLTADKTQTFSAALNRLSIAGRVFASTGRVLSGALVTLSGAEEQTAISDGNGDFSFSDLAAGGNYTVTVSRNNYDFSVASSSFNDLITDQYIAFQGVLRNYTISGKVTQQDPSSSTCMPLGPISGVQIWITGGYTTVTDANGDYSITVRATKLHSHCISHQLWIHAGQPIDHNSLGQPNRKLCR